MAAAGVIGRTGRYVRRALGVVKTELEARRALTGMGRERKPAKRDQQALRGDGIGDDDADQRSPDAPRLYAAPEHAAAPKQGLIMRMVASQVNGA